MARIRALGRHRLAFLLLACAARHAHADASPLEAENKELRKRLAEAKAKADAPPPTHCGHPCPARGSRGPTKNVHGWRKWKDLVHYHIAKNAGTTLRSVITKRYGGMELHGPGKKAYGEYFNDAGRKWAGRYFVTMARDPTSKLMSQFFYVRASLGGDFGTWHRCVTFEEYVESKRARHNHQFSQLVAGSRLAACDPSHNVSFFKRPRHEAGVTTAQDICVGGKEVLRDRIREILRQPRLFVGLVEDFDGSMVVLQRETGLPDATYCHKRTTKGALNKSFHLRPATRRATQRRNGLDEIFYDAAKEVHAWKRCCYGVDDASVAAFRAASLEYQDSIGCHARHDRKQKGLDNATFGDPNWHGRGTLLYGPKCTALDARKYALPGSRDSDQWRPKEDWCAGRLVDGDCVPPSV